MWYWMPVWTGMLLWVLALATAFTPPRVCSLLRSVDSATTTQLSADTTQLEQVLNTEYPSFTKLLLQKNAAIWKALADGESYTIFAPTEDAMAAHGDKRRLQLADDRNRETAEQMASFHVVNELVTADELFASAGVVTLGGVIDVGRSVQGGFFGIGGKEDGGVTVQGARVLRTIPIGNDGILHEMDSMVSPELLWRYCDQLRIPGSK
ncbi:predicted protein [Phaeodactylum tricornutum CCAP 1055/1]|uniref:FAS1 domain-containing protein n=1 Tax=Phaeodactylum tricornutum (strain CCAP 1055/1) TaxID=556484 RepID=B5Y4J8_PHATC|nr:predicted protein [Phaeodactylum tricornutum CCAP 1055/1]ACI65493.1 predicted protein [Phaeodactylum tricornutum CCAP 1055/1]|eukprot:XP_002186023.1 predicted protein [Phaeodactylum tricornutum CCAP 1055/1]